MPGISSRLDLPGLLLSNPESGSDFLLQARRLFAVRPLAPHPFDDSDSRRQGPQPPCFEFLSVIDSLLKRYAACLRAKRRPIVKPSKNGKLLKDKIPILRNFTNYRECGADFRQELEIAAS